MGPPLRRRELISNVLRLAPYIAIGILIGPVVTGLIFIIGPAFGYSLLLDIHGYSLDAFGAVFATAGIWHSIWLSFWIGPATALISMTIVALFTASFSGTRIFSVILNLIKPVLAMPHAAAAFALAFLLAPSGFLLRLLSPEVTGFTRPPDWLIINDPEGFALLVGLVAKEIPFLFLVLIAALPQADERRAIVARNLGHGRVCSWLVAVFPLVYAQIRLPVYAVIAFASSVVDVAMILGPGTPPTLSIQILRWMSDPDLSMRLVAAAAALVQFGVTLATLGAWWLIEQGVKRLGSALTSGGWRFCKDGIVRMVSGVGALVPLISVILGIGVLALWSVSGLWRFPEMLPRDFRFDTWMEEALSIWKVSNRAIIIGCLSSIVALIIVILCLENEYRRDIRLSKWARLTLYLPLLVPQVAFLTGLSIWLLWQGWDGNLLAVTFAHLIFVLPYTYLILADPWHSFDTRYLTAARLMGKSETMVMLSIRLPILLRPIMTAFALGFAISVAQYLPTLLIGAGRQPTITTEAVALASGGNRRLVGVYALMQTLLPFVMFALTAAIPSLLWRNRRALKPGLGQ